MTTELVLKGSVADPSFDFVLKDRRGEIPGTFWHGRATAGARSPLTLLQHGGPLHKRDERTEQLARSIVDGTGSSVMAIDGPIHGERRSDRPELMAMLGLFKGFWQEVGGIDALVADWKVALDTVLARGWADAERIAWFGVSMGTAYGIPLCAAEPRIKRAAMGMWGTDWGQAERLLEDARHMRTPVVFQIKAEDEIFTTAGQRQLFDAIGSPIKRLTTYAGGHSLTAPGQMDELLAFIAEAFDGADSEVMVPRQVVS